MGKGVNTKALSFSGDTTLIARMDEIWADRNRSEIINACIYAGICGDIDAILERYNRDRIEWLAQAARDKRRQHAGLTGASA